MPRTTIPTNVFGVPRTHSNVKIDIHSLATVFGILSNVAGVEEEEPETHKKLKMWHKLINNATNAQLDKIIPPHVNTIVTLLVGIIGEFKQDNLRDILSEAVELSDDFVQNGQMKEGQYKSFCDISMWMLDLLKSIDSYNNDKNEDIDAYDISASARYIKYKGINTLDIYIYKPIAGSF